MEQFDVEQALEKEPFIICPVHGDSMFPFINEDSDFVRLEKPHGVLDPYDLPLYRRPNGKLVLHRIIEVRRGYYVICGDNRSFRETVPYEWVVAVSTGVIKDGRYIAADSDEYRKYLEENVIGVVPEKRQIKHKVLCEWYTVLSLCAALLGRGEATVYENCHPPRLMRVLRGLSLASALEPFMPQGLSEPLSAEIRAVLETESSLRDRERLILTAISEAGVSPVLLGLRHADARLRGVCGRASLGSVLVSDGDIPAVTAAMRSLGYVCGAMKNGRLLFRAARGESVGSSSGAAPGTVGAVAGNASGSAGAAAFADTAVFAVYSDAELPSRFSVASLAARSSAVLPSVLFGGDGECDTNAERSDAANSDAANSEDVTLGDANFDDANSDAANAVCTPGGEKLILPQRRDLLELMCAGYIGRYLPIITSLTAQLWRDDLSVGGSECGGGGDACVGVRNGADVRDGGDYGDCGCSESVRAALESDIFREPFPEYKALIAPFGGIGLPESDEPSRREKQAAVRMLSPVGRLFPPLYMMKASYPVLCTAPVLLPVYWCRRLLGAAVRRMIRK